MISFSSLLIYLPVYCYMYMKIMYFMLLPPLYCTSITTNKIFNFIPCINTKVAIVVRKIMYFMLLPPLYCNTSVVFQLDNSGIGHYYCYYYFTTTTNPSTILAPTLLPIKYLTLFLAYIRKLLLLWEANKVWSLLIWKPMYSLIPGMMNHKVSGWISVIFSCDLLHLVLKLKTNDYFLGFENNFDAKVWKYYVPV